MTPKVDNEALFDRNIPLCFDTSAIFGNRSGPELLEQIRMCFPKRRLLVPVWTIAEKVRNLKAKLGANFNLENVLSFLDDDELKLEIVAFDRQTAVDAWLAVTEKFGPNDWGWEKRPIPTTRKSQPCAERCRTGDHIVYAIARSLGALLVTADRRLFEQVNRDGNAPGAVRAEDLKVFTDSS